MQIVRTERFKRAYKRLTPAQRKAVDKALFQLFEGSNTSGLGKKRIQHTRDIWEARASKSVRITFEQRDDMLLLRNTGDHDKVLKNP